MANLGKILKDEIRRMTGRQLRSSVMPVTRELRAIKRTLRAQSKLVDTLDRAVRRLASQSDAKLSEMRQVVVGEQVETARLRPASIKRIRQKLGLSRHQFAKLAGVTANAIYLWEVGKTVPRARAKAMLLDLRRAGKREVKRRLAALAAALVQEAPPAAGNGRRRAKGTKKATRKATNTGRGARRS